MAARVTREGADREVHSVERIRELGREARDEGRAFVEAARGVVTEAELLARERVGAAPVAALAVAFGFGVFLGGGLPFGAVRFAGRAATGVLVREVVSAAFGGAARPPAA